MKKVKINIKGTQEIDDQTETIEMISEGTLRKTDGGFVICYNEGEITGQPKTRTTLTVSNDKTAVISRSGTMSSRLIIKEGQRNNCFYSSPIGMLELGIYGEKVCHKLTEKGGEINLGYTLDQNKQSVSKNTVNIIIKEV